jgi:hypothetical protein
VQPFLRRVKKVIHQVRFPRRIGDAGVGKLVRLPSHADFERGGHKLAENFYAKSLQSQLSARARSGGDEEFLHDYFESFALRQPDITFGRPPKEMDNVGFLIWIPPLKKFNFHPGCNHGQARLLDLDLKTPVSQKKRIRMIE